MIRRIILFFLLLGFPIAMVAQQDPMYSLYMFNGLVINPAYAGTRDVLSTTLLYRNQWVSIPGAPKTGMFSMDAPIKKRRVGVGLNIEFDEIGVTNNTIISSSYSYKINFEKSYLTFGLQAGIGFLNSNLVSVKYSKENQNDPAFQNNSHEVLPNFGFGMYYYTDRYYIGFSIPQLEGHRFQKLLYGESELVRLDLANHYFLNSGYLFTISKDVKIKPSILLKYVRGAPMEFDINGIAWFYDILSLGISYRSLASLNFMFQIRLTNQIYFGYAYEYATNNLKIFSNGSHEIILQYLFDFSRARIITPRYF